MFFNAILWCNRLQSSFSERLPWPDTIFSDYYSILQKEYSSSSTPLFIPLLHNSLKTKARIWTWRMSKFLPVLSGNYVKWFSLSSNCTNVYALNAACLKCLWFQLSESHHSKPWNWKTQWRQDKIIEREKHDANSNFTLNWLATATGQTRHWSLQVTIQVQNNPHACPFNVNNAKMYIIA